MTKAQEIAGPEIVGFPSQGVFEILRRLLIAFLPIVFLAEQEEIDSPLRLEFCGQSTLFSGPLLLAETKQIARPLEVVGRRRRQQLGSPVEECQCLPGLNLLCLLWRSAGGDLGMDEQQLVTTRPRLGLLGFAPERIEDRRRA